LCGIVGIVQSAETPIDAELLARMCEAIRHRGPDNHGFYFKGVGLRMQRLSIIDLKGGRQPIPNKDRSAWVARDNNEVPIKESSEKSFAG